MSNVAQKIDEEFVPQLLLLMSCEQFFGLVAVSKTNENNIGELFQTINDAFKSNKSMTIVVVGVSSALSLSKALPKTLPIKTVDLEKVYLRLQLEHRCVMKFAERDEDLANLILSFTKSVTVAPEKRLKNLAPFSFHVDSLKQMKSVRVDLENGKTSLETLWKQILQQFHQMGIEQAQAIVQQYGTMKTLRQAYEQCSTTSQAKNLLAEIQVRRGAGILTTTRKIGPQMSERIWKFIMSKDANELL